MTFFRTNKCALHSSYLTKKTLLILSFIFSLFILVAPTLHAQTNTIPNDYPLKYDKAPNTPILSMQWYRTPQEISQRIDTNQLAINTRYFEDDTPYLEKERDGIKGRIFLKEVVGDTYTIYDLQFVPYTKRKGENATQESTQIPLFSERASGYSIVADVILYEQQSSEKRLVLYRYIKEQESYIYEETYLYTQKGALQRLTRIHADGVLERFVYYFSTGGLKESFYQNKDGSITILSYTIAGSLKTHTNYSTPETIDYELSNVFDSNNTLISSLEIDYDTNIRIESSYKNNLLLSRKTFSFAANNTTADNTDESAPDDADKSTLDQQEHLTLLYSEDFSYNTKGEEIDNVSSDESNEYTKKILYENDTRTEYYYKNNTLTYTITKKETLETKTFYFQDNPILIIYYDNKKKIKEEVLYNGEIIETRTFD